MPTKSSSSNRKSKTAAEPTDYIKAKVQVSKHYSDLIHNSLLNEFLETGQNPEIRLDAEALDDARASLRLRHLSTALKKARRRVTVHGPFMNLCPGGLDRLLRKVTSRRIAQTLKAAAILEPEHIVFHADFMPWQYGSHQDSWLKNSLSTWREAVVIAKALKINILLENTYEKSPRQLLPLMKNLAPLGVGFLLDIGHVNGIGGGTVQEWLTDLAPYIKAMHLHDNHGQGRDDHLALGEGSVDFEEVRRLLGELRLNPLLVLEVKQPEQVTTSLDYLARHWPERF